jgi:hypothetical protein
VIPIDPNSHHPTKDKSLLCLAVVRDNGADVVLFDASGSPRTFSYKQQQKGSGDNANFKVCFSSHGNDAADDFLTPCFDEDGYFGIPEESCFCGIETPHLHAHVHDPKTCDGGDQPKTRADGANNEAALMNLAKLTLHPTDDNPKDYKAQMLHIPITEQMPNECNADEFFSNVNDNGHNESSLLNRRRMHKVQVRPTKAKEIEETLHSLAFFCLDITIPKRT